MTDKRVKVICEEKFFPLEGKVLKKLGKSEDISPHVRLEINSEWLDHPEYVEDMSQIIQLGPDDLGFEILEGDNLLRIWGDVEVTLKFTSDVDDQVFSDSDSLRAFLEDYCFKDMFMYTLGLPYDGDEVSETILIEPIDE